ncbi:hypothetical protein LTR97_006208 [Elasticomyces elasticus]|uniref:Metallo-beta-lactamase domain-containing protein n=1 Tax=Elasticomyces elasticus TaxID=574655 RepID=A0AAN8A314_9PEZI|nr:hypothetical protein LTR97_006208 [Elasticomyces elasticus]
MVEHLPHLPDIERLSPRVVRILGGNPSKFTLQGTNTYLIGQGSDRILLDTGEGNRIWPETLKKALADEKVSISQVILTHWHPDHVGGVKDVRSLFPDIFKTDGATLRAFHSPGHAVDHMALVLDEENAMFTGDNVLGHGTAVFEDLATYIDSLERMQHQFTGRGYPAHGAVLDDGRAKIREYISHRTKREEEILAVLKQHPEGGEGSWTSMGVVKVVYKAYPENLHGPAEGGVVQVLKKLEGEGRAERVGDSGWRTTQRSAL